MKTALSWIKAYVPDLSVTDREYSDAMTLSGTKVEGFERLDRNLEKIVVGEILSIERHPDADKLIVATVKIKDGFHSPDFNAPQVDTTIQIVTGAPNVKVGDKVPVVLDGGKVAGGHDGGPLPENGVAIKKGKLRGVESFGMMCSIEELGSSRAMYPEAPEEGIYIFPKDTPVGVDAVELLGLRDTVFEYEVTSNRVDCYSVRGIAREAAATFGKPFTPPVAEVLSGQEKVQDYVSVEVADADLCPRYCARVCTNLKIAPSPVWMQRRLAASGIRPINNLVDITNYVMEEYGQPMHAFDLDTVAGHKIIVKRAKDGEKFQTLDGQERTLDADILMINDGEKPIGIAGIMGGENSKITDGVKTVLLESAIFNGANIRKSAKRLGLRTDASGKFEKGLEPHNAKEALDRACQLIQELGCGDVVEGTVDVCVELPGQRRIAFDPARMNRLLGTDIPEETMLELLARLEIYREGDELVIPYFRQDLLDVEDIIEEVARFYGYDKIPSTLPRGEATTGKLSMKLRLEQRARDVAEANGFSQGMCYSFESPKVFDKLRIPADDKRRNAVVISNPLGEDYSIMRTVSLNGMLTSLATNYNRRNKDVRLYEQGSVYLAGAEGELPEERMQMTFGLYGEGDFFTLKGVVEEYLESVGLYGPMVCDPASGRTCLHPGRQADIFYKDLPIGYLGEVHPEVADHYDIGTKVYVAVLDMPAIEEFATFDRKYQEIAKYPAVTRDISMVVPKEIPAGRIEALIAKRGGAILESCRLFDVYEGSQIKEGYKSLAYALLFRHKERTLGDEDVNAAMKKIMNGLEQLGIELRA